MSIAISPQHTSLDPQRIQHIIGGIMLLSQHSPLHRRYVIAEWLQRIQPSLEHNQFCFYEDGQGRPVAFCNWAFLSASIRDQLLDGDREISANDWQSGQHIFIPEMIAPFGHGRAVVNDLRRRIFLPWQGQKVCTVRGKVDQQFDRCIRKVQWFTI